MTMSSDQMCKWFFYDDNSGLNEKASVFIKDSVLWLLF